MIRAWDEDHVCGTAATMSMSLTVAADASTLNLCLPCANFGGGQPFVEDPASNAKLQASGPPGHILIARAALKFHPRLHAALGVPQAMQPAQDHYVHSAQALPFLPDTEVDQS